MIGKLQPCCTILCDINVIAIKPMRRNPRKQRCFIAAFSLFSPLKSSTSGRAVQGKKGFHEQEGLQEHGSSPNPRGHAGISASSLTSDFPKAQTRENCSEQQGTQPKAVQVPRHPYGDGTGHVRALWRGSPTSYARDLHSSHPQHPPIVSFFQPELRTPPGHFGVFGRRKPG